MSTLEESYRHCRWIARKSGSNFYRSFSLLNGDRRRGMDALYAFARLADDASDSPNALRTANVSIGFEPWYRWVDSLASSSSVSLDDAAKTDLFPRVEILEPIRLALEDSVQRFRIPIVSLRGLVDGVAQDQSSAINFQTWDELYSYCQRVASTVGVGCLAIWNPDPNTPLAPLALQAANDCGIAFQLTNILRDLAEDADRGRSYLPAKEAARFALGSDWLERCRSHDHSAQQNASEFLCMIVERAVGFYESGWSVRDFVCPEGRRMFTLMWSTYRQLLGRIEKDITQVFRGRVRLSMSGKIGAVANHYITPLYHRHEHRIASQIRTSRPLRKQQGNRSHDSIRVAIIGGGLAGCNAAMHLARHGVPTDLYEAKMRLGGRVGSFVDAESGQPIDYCQHVGMKCCKELVRWIEHTDQRNDWTTQSELHFVSKSGQRVRIGALPLPAPFHLAHLILRWPDLRWWDRFCIASALWKLVRMSPQDHQNSAIAKNWLQSNGQSEIALKHYWETILVSALGESIDRVSVGAARKVLVDGFAATRDAFHLLVPQKPLSELVNERMQHSLDTLGVNLRLRTSIDELQRMDDGRIRIQQRGVQQGDYDYVIVAVPWLRYSSLLEKLQTSHGEPFPIDASSMHSSPITGVHTWWDSAWLEQPHAILIDKMSQWVFPGPNQARVQDPVEKSEAYYQIVISASGHLPKGSPDVVLEAVREELCELFPSARKSKLLRGKVVTDPHAVFSISPESQSARLEADQAIEHGVLFAGDWTNTGWPATMEGAIRSGIVACECLLWDIGMPARIRIEN